MSATASSSTDLFLLWRLSALHVLSCSIDRAGCAASDALSSEWLDVQEYIFLRACAQRRLCDRRILRSR